MGCAQTRDPRPGRRDDASRGIRVDRPVPLDFSQAVQAPDWKQASMFGCMPRRDVLLSVGNEILEATMS
jgi:glycine amidinotransferase